MSPRRVQPLCALVVIQPFESHLRAIAPVAHALRALECKVIVAAPEKLRNLAIRTYRLPFITVGTNWPAENGVADRLREVLTSEGNDAFCRTLISDYLAGPNVVDEAKRLNRLAQQLEPDVIVSDITDFASSLIAESLSVPQLRFDNGWAQILNANKDLLRTALAPRRIALRLPETQPSYVTKSIFTPLPPEFLLTDSEPEAVIGYQHENPRRRGERLPGHIASMPTDRPLIYVALGTILTASPAFAPLVERAYRRIIDALSKIKCTAVFSVGADLRNSFSPPSHIHIERSVPQTVLLNAGVDLFITHAGLGSLRESIHAGVPMLFAPLSSDQFDNAARAASHGVGAPLDFNASVDEIRETILSALANPQLSAATTHWQRQLLALEPLDTILPRHLA